VSSQTLILSLILGIVLPFVTTYLTSATWPQWVRFLCCIVAAGVVGFLQLWATERLPGLTWTHALDVLTLTYTASAATFWVLIDSTGLRLWLEQHGWK